MNRREFIGALAAVPMVAVVQPKPAIAFTSGWYGSFGGGASLHGSEAVLGYLDVSKLAATSPDEWIGGLGEGKPITITGYWSPVERA